MQRHKQQQHQDEEQRQKSYDYQNQMNTVAAAVDDDVHLPHQDCKHILLQLPGAVVAAVGAVEVRKRTFPLNAENDGVDVNPCHEIHDPSQTRGSSAVDWTLTEGAVADHDHR